MSERKIWGVSEGDFPAAGPPRKKLEFALPYATLAPTAGNWQPWYFRLAETQVDLMAKKNPVREAVDPDRREFMLGCGSALLYLKHTLKHFGCLGRVEIFPDLGQPELVARLHAGTGRERDAREKLLFEAMPKSPSPASSLGEPPVTEAMLMALAHAATGERSWLDFVQSETSRRQVLEVALAEDQHWTDGDSSGEATTDETTDTHASRWPQPIVAFGDRDVDVWDEMIEPVSPPVVATATLAVVKTKTDDKHGWLEAGQTMARTVLQAQALGMSWAFVDPVRRREARAALRMGVGHKGFAQVILRFGPLGESGTTGLAAPAPAPETYW